jgi:hypothetical protein
MSAASSGLLIKRLPRKRVEAQLLLQPIGKSSEGDTHGEPEEIRRRGFRFEERGNRTLNAVSPFRIGGLAAGSPQRLHLGSEGPKPSRLLEVPLG